jgi:putative endonuclease
VPGASVYIVLCRDRSYYTGITRREVEERVSEHNRGIDPDCYTFLRRPVRLVYSEHFERIDEAIATERRVKGWSRAKKEALIRRDYDALPGLALRGNARRRAGVTPFETRPAGAPQGEGGAPPTSDLQDEREASVTSLSSDTRQFGHSTKFNGSAS